MTRDQNSQDAFCCCCSAAQLCPTLCKPMDYSMLGFPSITISQSLLKLMFTEMVMPPNHLILRHPLLLLLPSIFPASGSFLMCQFLTLGGQSIGASALASVLPMYIQGLFLLGLTGVTSWQSKGISRVFSNTTIQKHHFFGA